jgi:glutathione S-transferase
MTSQPRITFYHSPQSRSVTVRMLVEELGAHVDLRPIHLRKGDSHTPEYLRLNPMGKVPTIVHDGAVVTETTAICQYLAELFPQAGLHVPPGDALRGPYLRWLAYYGACFEPAILDRALKRDAPPRSTAGYGDFDTVYATITQQFEGGPWLLGDRFTAADVLWGSGLNWTMNWKLLPEHPALRGYLDRFLARPAIQRAIEKDAALAQEMGLNA